MVKEDYARFALLRDDELPNALKSNPNLTAQNMHNWEDASHFIELEFPEEISVSFVVLKWERTNVTAYRLEEIKSKFNRAEYARRKKQDYRANQGYSFFPGNFYQNRSSGDWCCSSESRFRARAHGRVL